MLHVFEQNHKAGAGVVQRGLPFPQARDEISGRHFAEQIIGEIALENFGAVGAIGHGLAENEIAIAHCGQSQGFPLGVSSSSAS